MRIRLICLDADGTLLRPNLSVAHASRAAIARAQARGVSVLMATGRVHAQGAALAAEAGLYGPLVSANGGLVREPETGRTLLSRPLAMRDARAILDMARELRMACELFQVDRLYANRPVFGPDPGVPVFPLAEWDPVHAGRPPEKLVLGHPDRQALDRAAAWLALEVPGVRVARKGPDKLLINAAGVDKGAALLAVARHLRVLPGEVMAVGDGLTDLPMFAVAGLAVATGAAPAVVRQAAHHVLGGGPEDTVALAIARFVLPPVGS